MKPFKVSLDGAGAAARLDLALIESRRPLLLWVQQGGSSPIPHCLLSRLLRHPMPVTGWIGGDVAGPTAWILLAADSVFVRPGSRLAPVPYPGPGAVLLPLRIGSLLTRRVAFRGGILFERDIVRGGWGTRFSGDVEAAAKEVSRRFAGLSPAALSLLRPLVHRQTGLHPLQATALERYTFSLAWAHGDARAGVRAFFEKRAPRFDST
ncbi:MAG: hypothetical protein P8Z49_06950 [Acidobacteriota bacterium]